MKSGSRPNAPVECLDLALRFHGGGAAVERARKPAREHLPQRQERPVRRGRTKGTQRPEWRGEGEMQAERRPRTGIFGGDGSRARALPPASKLGAPTITEVALMRPRAMRSRMARFTAGEMP